MAGSELIDLLPFETVLFHTSEFLKLRSREVGKILQSILPLVDSTLLFLQNTKCSRYHISCVAESITRLAVVRWLNRYEHSPLSVVVKGFKQESDRCREFAIEGKIKFPKLAVQVGNLVRRIIPR